MKNVFVIGAGTMGLDIAQVFATAGYNVTAYGRTDASIGKSSAKLTKSLTKRVDRGKMTQEAADAILAHITFVTDYENLKTSDLVIEAGSAVHAKLFGHPPQPGVQALLSHAGGRHRLPGDHHQRSTQERDMLYAQHLHQRQ